MKTTAKPSKHDWSRFDAMSEAQRHAAATRDPDAMPLTPADFKHMKRTPQVKLIRRALGADSKTDIAACFLRLAELPTFALDRLSRY